MLARGDSADHSNGDISTGHVAAMGVTNGTQKAAMVTNGTASGNADTAAASRRSQSYFGHDRQEVSRILYQALSDMGYQATADSLCRESGFDFENPTVKAFRHAILNGIWAEAETLLSGAISADSDQGLGNGLVLSPKAEMGAMRFLLRQQKFLELLEQRDSSQALTVLRGELTPLYQDTAKLHFLSSLLMCHSAEDLKARANWDGASGNSRQLLLSDLARKYSDLHPGYIPLITSHLGCISPSVMLPENRLAILFNQVKQSQVDYCLYHTAKKPPSLYSDHCCPRRQFISDIAIELPLSGFEVWQVKFSNNGSKLAASGSSLSVIIYDTSDFHPLHILRGHEKGVGNIAWKPDDSMIVTCSQDKYARLWHVESGQMQHRVRRFEEPVTGCVWAADGESFVLGSLAKSQGLVGFDSNDADDQGTSWQAGHRVQDLCGSRDGRWLAAINDRDKVYVYSQATRELAYKLDFNGRPTSVYISQDSRHILVNNFVGEAQLLDLESRQSVQTFQGHKGGDFMLRSSLGGANENFAVSGSEDGKIYIWHKVIGVLVQRLLGHSRRCNSVSWNPKNPCMLASCGDDGLIKMYVFETMMKLGCGQ